MTQSVVRSGSGRVPVGAAAARVLVAELARHPDPKTGLVVGAEPGSPVLTAALQTLLPGDSLTIVADPVNVTAVRDEVREQGRWVTDRVRVVGALTDAGPADIVVAARTVDGTDAAADKTLTALRDALAPGGVLTLAVPARPGGGEGDLVADQVDQYGVGSDLVLRNLPPVRVHRFRYTPADPVLAERLRPVRRPSSVRLTTGMHVDSNGVAAAALCLGAAAVLRRTRSGPAWLLPALAAAPVAAFFRDPERAVPDDPGAVVAASDGKVLAVERLTEERLGPGEWLRIVVFLSVLDVHVNRAPVAGRVVDMFRVDGGFAAAMKPGAEHNVAAYTLLDTPNGRVAVAQRTGLIARRIVHRTPVGALVAKGERFGLIRFGSRTDVYLPAEAADPAVVPGDRVVGGVTVIANWR